MDVRCEKCGTEYEFDEGKLKPGGVTVKCAECGHMFRVRKRSSTSVNPVPPASPSQPPPMPGEPAAPHQVSPTPSPPAGGLAAASGASGRVWLVRDEEGKVQTCRELATLQQWVVAGRVTRDCEISRTGKSWKKLGTIAELGSFFRIAEEARRAASGAMPAQPVRQTKSNGEAAAPTATVPENTEPLPGVVKQPGPAAKRESGPPPATRPRPSRPVPSVAGTPSPDHDAAPAAAMQPGAAQNTGGWVSQKSLRVDAEADGPRGPTGGIARGLPTKDAAFAAGEHRFKPGARADDIMPKQFEPTDAFLDDDTDFARPPSGAGKWIVLVSLVLLAGAGAAVYLFVFKADERVDKPGALATGAADAGAEAPETSETPEAMDPGEALTASYGDLASDTAIALDTADKRLAKLEVDDPPTKARVLAAQARILTARAQHVLDAGGDTAKSEAKKLADEAAQLAADALAEVASDAEARVAMADALRLKGSRTADVERHLKQVLQGDPRDREAKYVRALLRERDGKTKDARELYAELAAEGTDVRPIYRLARLDFDGEDLENARSRAERVLGMQSEHVGARALKLAIDKASAVVQSDPMPPEVDDGDDDDDDDGKRRGGGSRGGGSYESLLARADKLAETGKCSKAMEQYRRALDANPGGVGALVGMGYCHIDARQFASAHAKFRAALGISSRHHGALIGIAEAYRYQGLTKQAVEAYRRYLEIHPGGPKATMARKQIERLGGADEKDEPDDGDSDVPDDGPFDDEPPTPEKSDTDLGERVDPGAGE